MFLEKTEIFSKKALKLRNIFFFLFLSIFLYIFLMNFFLDIYNRGILSSHTFSSDEINVIIGEFEVLLIWAIGTGVIFFVILPLGFFTKFIPKLIHEIIISNNFKVQFRDDQEIMEKIAVIDLDGAKIEIKWDKSSGRFQHWTLLLNYRIIDKNQVTLYETLAMMLFMEKIDTNGYTFEKKILARNWTKQEYIINYWHNLLHRNT